MQHERATDHEGIDLDTMNLIESANSQHFWPTMITVELHHIESFGVVIALEGPGEIHRLLTSILPSAKLTDRTTPDVAYEIRERRNKNDLLGYEVWRPDNTLVARAKELESVANVLANQLHFEIASHAGDHVFVHAGVVAMHDQAIVIPGRSMSGKTTLVTELLRQGATYYSDEYAVFDPDGLVHPYARQLRVRAADGTSENHLFSDFTTQVGTTPIPVGMIAVLRYEQGSTFEISPLSSGAAALALIDNTVRVRDAPAPSVRAASTASQALGIEGVRDEASEAATALLERAFGAFRRR